MNKLTLTLCLFATVHAGSTFAQSESINSGNGNTRPVQAAVVRTAAPVMDYETANLIKIKNEAEAKYRKTGSDQDFARFKALKKELTTRGYGQATTPAPYQ